jgi:large subunit ribosomal protein L19
MNLTKLLGDIESEQLKSSLPKISVGDLVKVGILIQEGNKERVQPYEGTVIAKHNAGSNTTITVRRVFQGIGVERIFLIHSPRVASIQVLSHSKIRRAKLYYLRSRVGKATRLKQRFEKP